MFLWIKDRSCTLGLELFYRSSVEYFAPSEGDMSAPPKRRVTIENFAKES